MPKQSSSSTAATKQPPPSSPPTKRQRSEQPSVDWHLYPSLLSRRTFPVGSRVFVRPKSAKELGRRGTVLLDATDADTADTADDAADDIVVAVVVDDGKVLVRLDDYDDGDTRKSQTKRIAIKRLLLVFPTTTTTTTTTCCRILVTAETSSYRNLASSQVTKSDSVVLEIGCSTGEASLILTKYGKEWMGFDTSNSMIAKCKANLKDGSAKAYKVDALADPDRATELVANQLMHGPPTTVFLDIGGNRECEGVLRMIDWVLTTFGTTTTTNSRAQQPLLLVIKSRELHAKLKEECAVDDINTGRLASGSTWVQDNLNRLDRKIPSHPLQAPLRRLTKDHQPICRYHNYHKDGCKRYNDGGQCELDHAHCHMCFKEDHVALQCPTVEHCE